MNAREPNGGGPPASNIAEFERSSAMILSKLYESFPVPIELAPSQLESGASAETLEILSYTIEFLAAEGYLRFEEIIKTHGFAILFSDVVLTAKGLAILDARQDDAKEESQPDTKGKRLMDAMRTGAIDIAKTIVRELLSEGLKHVLR
jgi:hypothetical protein